MVDRKARDEAAAAIQKLIEGSISNDEYERKSRRNKQDAGLEAVSILVWNFYSDLSEHKLIGKYSLTDDQRTLLQRCVLFLKSDLEFEWPRPKIGLRFLVIRLLGFGWVLDRQDEKQTAAGDINVWPFIRTTDYEKAGHMQ